MSFTHEPLHIVPRMLPRRWGKKAVTAWCADAPRPDAPIGEVWLAQANNVTRDGRHLGEAIAQNPGVTLGELGRAPPSLRLLLAEEPSDLMKSDAPISLWRVTEGPLDGVMSVQENEDTPERTIRARRDMLYRADAGVGLRVGPGITALEVRGQFSPGNQMGKARLRRVYEPDAKTNRSVWLRDPALSVELWTLPEFSWLEPDGETCHVILAMTPGVTVDGRRLSRGDAVFLPAQGKRVSLLGRGAQVLCAHPDVVPTEIWKTGRPPRPAALAVDPASAYASPSMTGGAEVGMPFAYRFAA